MFDSRARELQQQAVEALSDLRTWIWARHAALLPDDLAAITREEAERYATVLDWYSRIEESILTLAAAAPCAAAASAEAAPAAITAQPASAQPSPAQPSTSPGALLEQLSAATVRAPTSFGAGERSQGWQPVISVLAPVEPQRAARAFKAA